MSDDFEKIVKEQEKAGFKLVGLWPMMLEGKGGGEARPTYVFRKDAAKTTATTVRMKNGKRIVQDGPFADAKEQLGGYFILESPSIDAVLEWAARVPGLEDGSAVEIRPILVMTVEG